MDNFEKVEKLREKANVTYEEAKTALENSNWDMLDAMIYLEKNGKVKEDKRAEYTTKTEMRYRIMGSAWRRRMWNMPLTDSTVQMR